MSKTRILGIDFGSKRVGVAVSDDSATIAQPLVVLKNSKTLLSEIEQIISEQNVEAVVIGESKDFKGKNNLIMEEINDFVGQLSLVNSIPIYFEPEFLSSHQAQQLQGKNDMLDASSAAIILQSYLNRKK
jgi:putative Holliday junction resolvase